MKIQIIFIFSLLTSTSFAFDTMAGFDDAMMPVDTFMDAADPIKVLFVRFNFIG